MTSPIKKWAPLLVLSLALAIIVIDTTLLNVAIGTLIRELHTDIQHIQWVITAYALMLAALTITGGRLGDLFGRKRMFVVGAIIFAIGSLVASFSQSVGVLILGEAIIEGIGAVLMLPATSSLLVANYRGRDRALAFGVWGGIAAAASAIGPILGGWLTTNYSWRWGFRINVVVVIILVSLSFLIKESRDMEEKPALDWIGILLSAAGLLLLAFGIIEASTFGWWLAKTPFLLAGHALKFPGNLSITIPAIIFGLIFLAVFLAWELLVDRRGGTPLVSLELFKNRRFTAGALTTGVAFLGLSGLTFAIPIFYQAVRNLDAFHTGLGLLPMSLLLLVAAPTAAYISKWFYPRTLVLIGLGLNMSSYLLLIYSLTPAATAWTLAPGLALFGLGMGFIVSQINNITLSAVSIEEAGEASGVNNTIRQIGQMLGSAIIGSILISSIASGLASGVASSAVIPDNLKPTLQQALATQASNVEFAGGAQLGATIPDSVRTEIVAISHASTAAGNRRALWYALGFSIIALLMALRLPREKNVEFSASVARHH